MQIGSRSKRRERFRRDPSPLFGAETGDRSVISTQERADLTRKSRPRPSSAKLLDTHTHSPSLCGGELEAFLNFWGPLFVLARPTASRNVGRAEGRDEDEEGAKERGPFFRLWRRGRHLFRKGRKKVAGNGPKSLEELSGPFLLV